MFLETIKVQHPDSADHWLNINLIDFDPEIHTVWVNGSDPTSDRQAELAAMTWRELKLIAENLGIEKREDQAWEDVIPEILTAESAIEPDGLS